MKTKYMSMLLALISFTGLSVTAQAQTRGEIKVNLPFEFMVSGE